MQSNLGLNSFLRNILEERHEPHNFMVPIERQTLDLVHEDFIGELSAHLHSFLLLINCVIRILAVRTRHNRPSRWELIVVMNTTCGKTCKVIMVAEQGSKNVVACVVGGPGKNPKSLGTMHLVQHTVRTLVQKGSVIYEMHPSGVVIEFDIISHRHSHRVSAAFFS